MTGLLQKAGIQKQTHTQGKDHMRIKEETGEVSTCQGMPKIASKAPKARGETWNRVSLMVLIGSNSANTLISDT